MKNTVKINSVDLINADCLHFIQSLPDDSIDLIVTDPPYFKVKPNGWDNQWKGNEDYLKWLDHCLAQFWRVLKPAGSLYLFCGHRLASDIEIMMRERFNVLNHIIWAKPSGRWNGCNKESLRAYFPATERVLFAEHYQGPYRGKSDGYAAKESQLKQHILTAQLHETLPDGAVIHIVPRVAGAKSGGVFQIVLGAAAIAGSFFTAGATLAAWGAAIGTGGMTGILFSLGASMVLGGVAQMLAPKARTPRTQTTDNGKQNTYFSSLDNMVAQGNVLPVLYGEMRVGSRVVSQEISTADEGDGGQVVVIGR